MMATDNFTAVGDGTTEILEPGGSCRYGTTGTSYASWLIERSNNGGRRWSPINRGSGVCTNLYRNDSNKAEQIRYRCTGYGGGTLTAVITPGVADLGAAGDADGDGVYQFEDEDLLIVDPSDTTKKARLDCVNITTGNTRVLTLPDASMTLVGEATTQTLSGKTLADPTVTGAALLTAGAAAPASALIFGDTTAEGLRVRVIEEVVNLSGAGAAYKNLTSAIPSGAVILGVQANIDALVVAGGTTVKVAIGIAAGDVDKYGLATGLTQNLKINTIPAHAVLGSSEQLAVCGVVTDGSALGDTNLSSGSVRVRIVYIDLLSLANT